ncbi:MAG: metal-sensing transcriptional repressor [Kiritimatiellae bacterium]|nr:metal-sensing transcriptional repressor [Kiritimatiellia bacterium]
MARSKKNSELNTPDVYARIHKVIGQCQGIERMLDDGKSCETILLQINAAKSALHRMGQLLLERHLAVQITEGAQKADSGEAVIKKVSLAVDYFCRMK